MKLVNNTKKIMDQMANNIDVALDYIGQDLVTAAQYMMLYGYSKPHKHRHTGITDTKIYDTGALYKDLKAQKDWYYDTVHVGNSLPYAVFVHEGTRKVEARPYLEDALYIADIEDAAIEFLRKGIAD